jgi:hypothetical protein
LERELQGRWNAEQREPQRGPAALHDHALICSVARSERNNRHGTVELQIDPDRSRRSSNRQCKRA